MIPPIYSPWAPGIWQQLLKEAYRDARELLADLQLDPDLAAPDANFKTLVPRSFAARMVTGDANDPLLRQVLPIAAEHDTHAAFVVDPLRETASFTRAPGLIQKYQGRALLIAAPQCAVHCRYCFRREFPYSKHRPKHLDQALAELAQDKSIHEIILSGGDPMLLSDGQWTELLAQLAQIPHLARLRLHTRLPIVLPERVTASWMKGVADCRLPCTLVVHTNHPNELDDSTERAFATLRAGGIHLLNQGVLLRGVNDSVETQVALHEKLYCQGVLPYYLHMPDPVQGTAHFFLDEIRAREIYQGMQTVLPGYLLPKLVQERPGSVSKTLIS
jgi:EF-P beta-lysylation protein EpmB